MNNNHRCTQLETIYSQKTEIALIKQYLTTLDREFSRIRNWQITNTVLLITGLAGIIAVLVEAYFNR